MNGGGETLRKRERWDGLWWHGSRQGFCLLNFNLSRKGAVIVKSGHVSRQAQLCSRRPPSSNFLCSMYIYISTVS